MTYYRIWIYWYTKSATKFLNRIKYEHKNRWRVVKGSEGLRQPFTAPTYWYSDIYALKVKGEGFFTNLSIISAFVVRSLRMCIRRFLMCVRRLLMHIRRHLTKIAEVYHYEPFVLHACQSKRHPFLYVSFGNSFWVSIRTPSPQVLSVAPYNGSRCLILPSLQGALPRIQRNCHIWRLYRQQWRWQVQGGCETPEAVA